MKISRRLSFLVALAAFSLLFGCSLSGNDKDDDNPLGWDGPDSVSGGSDLASAATLTSLETWYEDDIGNSISAPKWYKIGVTPGTEYTVAWDDYDSSDDYEADIEVYVVNSSSFPLGDGDYGLEDYVDVIPTENFIYIRVESIDEPGEFAIGVSEAFSHE